MNSAHRSCAPSPCWTLNSQSSELSASAMKPSRLVAVRYWVFGTPASCPLRSFGARPRVTGRLRRGGFLGRVERDTMNGASRDPGIPRSSALTGHIEHESRGIVATGSEQSPAVSPAGFTGRPPVIHEGLPTQLPDIDPDETGEWLHPLDPPVDDRGRGRGGNIMLVRPR